MMASTRRALALSLFSVFMLTGSVAAEPNYPTRAIRVIVPYAAGGTTDVLMRLIGQKLTERWQQPVIIDNKPGGGTIIGVEAGARAAPDGYTVTVVANSFAVNPSFRKTLPYDTLKDFVPVMRLASTPLILAVHPSIPVGSAVELVAYVKKNPGKLSYGSIGLGSSSHLVGEAFKAAAGINLTHIPYKGQAPALNDLLAGHVGVMFGNMPDVMPHVRAGSLKALAITSPARSSLEPSVPTMVEAGLTDVVAESWFGLLAPTGTPPEIVAKLNTEIGRVLSEADVKEKLAAQGLERSPGSSADFAAYLRAEIAKYAKILKAAGVQPE